MKLLDITNSRLVVQKLDDDWWKLDKDILVIYYTDEGTYRWSIKREFLTNFRSGGNIPSPILDKIGSFAIAWLVHDACYCDETVSRQLSDQLMKLALRYYGANRLQAWLAIKSVRWFGARAYGDSQEDLVSFQHLDK